MIDTDDEIAQQRADPFDLYGSAIPDLPSGSDLTPEDDEDPLLPPIDLDSE